MNATTDFREIVETHQERVRNTCFRYVHNRQDADDLAQDVFIRVFESMSQFRQEADLSTWIYRIAVNKSIDFLRQKKRKKRMAALVSLFGFTEREEEIVPDTGNNPQQNLEEQERRQILQEAVEKLPENQKSVVILSKYQGFSNKEIAGILNITVSAVESLMHRAKKNLHRHLKVYYEKTINQ